MMKALQQLRGTRVIGRDGPAGSLRDVYFDEPTWTVRYLVVDAYGPLRGRVLLVPAASVTHPELASGAIAVDLTRAQVTRRAGIDDFQVRSAMALQGYAVHSADSLLGRVEDVVLNDTIWSICRLIVHVRDHLMPGRFVGIPAGMVSAIDCVNRVLHLRLTRAEVCRLPAEFPPTAELP